MSRLICSIICFTGVYNISDALSQVITDIDSLTSAADNLTSALDTLATNINSTVSTCSASGVACQAACDSIDTSVLTSASADFSSVSYKDSRTIVGREHSSEIFS